MSENGASKQLDVSRGTFRFGIICWFLWFGFLPVSYGSTYMLERGLSGTAIGLALVAGNVLAIVIQPIVASIADHDTGPSICDMERLLALITVLAMCLCLVLHVDIVYMAAFALGNTMSRNIQALNNSMSVYYINRGARLDFGMARAMGSISWSVASVALGFAITNFGIDAIIYAVIALNLIFFFVLGTMPTPKDVPATVQESAEAAADTAARGEGEVSYGTFLRTHPKLLLVIVGFALSAVFGMTIQTYGIRIFERVGGDASNLGIGVALSAMMELPVMMGYSWLNRHLGPSKCMRLASVGPLIKGALIMLAPSVPMLYVGYASNLLFGNLYTPANVAYGNRFFSEADKNKALGLLMMNNAIGNIVGNSFGGIIYDSFGLDTLLHVAMVVGILGAVVANLGIENEHAAPQAE